MIYLFRIRINMLKEIRKLSSTDNHDELPTLDPKKKLKTKN